MRAPKPTKRKPILAKHAIRKDVEGKVLYRLFTKPAWKVLPDLHTTDAKGAPVVLSKQGWVEVNPKATVDPPEAVEADKAKATKATSK